MFDKVEEIIVRSLERNGYNVDMGNNDDLYITHDNDKSAVIKVTLREDDVAKAYMDVLDGWDDLCNSLPD